MAAKPAKNRVFRGTGNTSYFPVKSKISKKKKEDLIFARRTKEAWKRYDRGEFTSSSAEEFLEELKKW